MNNKSFEYSNGALEKVNLKIEAYLIKNCDACWRKIPCGKNCDRIVG